MEYPYIDYYKSPVDNQYHLVIHYGPNRQGAYTCKLILKAKTEREIRSYLETNGLTGKRRKK